MTKEVEIVETKKKAGRPKVVKAETISQIKLTDINEYDMYLHNGRLYKTGKFEKGHDITISSGGSMTFNLPNIQYDSKLTYVSGKRLFRVGVIANAYKNEDGSLHVIILNTGEVTVRLNNPDEHILVEIY